MSRFTTSALALLATVVAIGCSESTGPRATQVSPDQTATLSGSGSSGGGGGGVVTVVPAGCSQISLMPKSGYTPQGFSYAAVWVTMKLKNCGTTPMTLQAELTHDRTGLIAGSSGGIYYIPAAVPYVDITPQPWIAQPGDSLMVTVDYDFDNYSTSYTSVVSLKDYTTGAILATCSAVSVTPKPRGLGGSTGGGSNGSSDTACYK